MSGQLHKSRSDDTLLTADFNLRAKVTYSPKVPHGTTLCACSTVPAGLVDLGRVCYRRLRYASPAVNKVLSLRDFASSIARNDRSLKPPSGVGGNSPAMTNYSIIQLFNY